MNIKEKQRWGFAVFGKRDGFELIHTEGELKRLQGVEGEEALSQFLQLRLEEIRLQPNTYLLRLSKIDPSLNIITLFTYALDNYQRDGYLAASLGMESGMISAESAWKYLWELQTAVEQGHTQLPRFPEEEFQHIRPRPYGGHAVFIPLNSRYSQESLNLIQTWIDGKLASYGTTYFSPYESIKESIQTQHIHVLENNPFWVQEETGIRETTAKHPGEESKVRRSPSAIDPQSSLVHAFESGGEVRWEKESPPQQKKVRRRDSWIWGIVGVVFIGIVIALMVLAWG